MKMLPKIITTFLLALTVIIYGQAINQERFLVKSLYEDPLNITYQEKVLSGLPIYEVREKLAVAIYNRQINSKSIDCNQLVNLSNGLLAASNRSSQGYYLQTACQERSGRIPEAISSLNNALKFDPLNTQYLLGMAILYLNSSMLDQAKPFLDKVGLIDPNTENYRNILQVYNQKIMSKN